ncbi:hypothetical protein PsWM33_04577 [Pseudovibrio sp. WM33]|nr:hypothetical protein PsWM33_04577 [Pseudovibrio sp. WM33]
MSNLIKIGSVAKIVGGCDETLFSISAIIF